MIDIFIVEATNEDKSKEMYVKKFINMFYDYRGNKLQFVYMEDKQKYSDHSVVSETNSWKKKYPGQSEVFMFIDIADENTNQEIVNYCAKQNYHLIWFNNSIEEVFIGKKANLVDRQKLATEFYVSGQINDLQSFYINTYAFNLRKSSNIGLVLDAYLKRKLIF